MDYFLSGSKGLWGKLLLNVTETRLLVETWEARPAPPRPAPSPSTYQDCGPKRAQASSTHTEGRERSRRRQAARRDEVQW